MKELGICLIGAGRAGMIHGYNFNSKVKGAKMVAVVDVVEEVAKKSATELGIENYYTDYKKALQNDKVDAVVIVSPTNFHKQIVIDSANLGKHIFCEKPMAMNVEECQEMIDVCKKNSVKLQIGFMRRHDASFVRAKEIIESGAIGDICLINSCTRGPSKPREWMYDVKKANGVLGELNSHDIDCIRWLADSEIKSIFAVGGNFRNKEVAEKYPDYYDSVIMSGQFENGIQYAIDGAAYIQYGYDAKVEVVGTKGKIQIGRSDAEFIKTTTTEQGTATPFITSWTELFRDAYVAEDQGFVDAIINNKEPKVTGYDGLMAVKIVELANKALAQKEIIIVQ